MAATEINPLSTKSSQSITTTTSSQVKDSMNELDELMASLSNSFLPVSQQKLQQQRYTPNSITASTVLSLYKRVFSHVIH